MPKRLKLPDGRTLTLPDDATDEEIDQLLAELDADAPPAGAAEAPPADAPATPEREKDWVDALPSAMGTLFSIAGGSKALPTGMALGGLGGGFGEGLRQIVRSVQGRDEEVPDSALERLQAMGSTAVSQGGLEAVGRGLGAVVTPAAKAVYGMALRPAFHTARNVGGGNLRQGMERIVSQGFEDRVLPTTGGAQKAGRLLDESKAAADAMAADPRAPTINLMDIVADASADQGKQASRALTSAGVAPKSRQINAQLQRMVNATGSPMLYADEVQAIRRGAEDVADPVFKAAHQPGGAGYVPGGSEASVARSIAGSAKRRLEGALGPAFAAQNRTTQARHGLREATEYAAARPNMLTNLVAGGVGVGSGDDWTEKLTNAAATRAIFSPTAMAGASFLAPGAARHAPRGLDMLAGGDLNKALKQAIEEALGGGR